MPYYAIFLIVFAISAEDFAKTAKSHIFRFDKKGVICYTFFMKKRQTIKTHFIKKPEGRICRYALDSPHPEDEVSFNYLSIPFPYLHFHDHWEILIVIDGLLTHTINGKAYSMKIGDACFIKPADAHYFTFEIEKEVRTLTFIIKNEYMRKICAIYGDGLYDELLHSEKPLKERLSAEFITSIMPTILSVQANTLDAQSRLFQTKIILNRIIDKFIFSAYNLKEQNPGWFNNFLAMLNNPHLDFDNVADLAKYTPYSYSRLSRIFKAHTGYTIIEYISSVKINMAKDAFLYTDKTIAEIAQETGFLSISHFNRTFKKFMDMSPSEFRKANKL